MNEGRQLYPRPIKEPKHTNRRWRIEYNLAYEGGSSEFTVYYRTKATALISCFIYVKFSSWGGSAILFDNRSK